MLSAPINKIIPFSNVDGPGNRFVIFFQTCNFECYYCHNPETIKTCINCGDCINECPTFSLFESNGIVRWNPNTCIQCDKCIEVCKHMSSPKILDLTIDEVFKQILSYKSYIKGITVSGGECTLHSDFIIELFKRVKEIGLTCLIDSNGYFDYKRNLELLNLCDGVMLDIKAKDNSFHNLLTKKSNMVVLENFKFLQEINKLYEVRIVVLPLYRDSNIETINYVTKHMSKDSRLKLIRYRHYGVRQDGLNFFQNMQLSEDDFNNYVNYAKLINTCKIISV